MQIRGEKMYKNKLNVDEQIEDLKNKGVSFNEMSEAEAKKFLRYNNYYFKLKSYARNYQKYNKPEMQGKYINLDFAYLIELSTLDMYLRKIIMQMCLDIEHFLKVRLMYDISNNSDEDGYNIVNKYLDGKHNILNDLYKNAETSATAELIAKFHDNDSEISIWKFVETLSFGRFVEIYDLYYGTYGGYSYSSYLGSIKFLRNAAAHNNCLLNSIRKPYQTKIHKTMKVLDKVSKIKNIPTSYTNKMSNPVIHDFVALLFVYSDLLNYPANRNMREKGIETVKHFFDTTLVRKKDYFLKNDVLCDNYNFMCLILKFLENNRNGKIL
jgi:abortive infection bacteriophage resistance protein